MEQRRALTIPFSLDKDQLMENPLKICISSDCGKLDRQVSWKTFSGGKLRHCDSQHKNVSVLFDHNHATLITLEMARRKPCVVLTDVLKTEQGKTHMERIKQSHSVGNGGQMSSTRSERSRSSEDTPVCRKRRSSQREATRDKSTTPGHNQNSNSSSAQRSSFRRRLQAVDNREDKREKQDNEEVIIGKSNGTSYTFAEVVDCGLSVSWEPVENTGGCDEFSAASIRDQWADPEKEEGQLSVQKRKRKDAESQCNGTTSPKHHRESVLRLTKEDRKDGRPPPARASLEEDGDLESLDRSILQFTVGGDNGTDVLVPIINPNSEAGDVTGSRRRSLSSSQDSSAKTTGTPEPIVLSSDDEESGHIARHRSPTVHTLVTLEDVGKEGQLPQEAAIEQDDPDEQDMQVLRVVVEEPPGAVALSPLRSVDHSCMSLSFTALHCGGFQGKANGEIMLADEEIIIPLTDTTEQANVMLTFKRKALRRYSVWEEQEMEMRELHFQGDEEPPPAAVLLFCVTEVAAAAVQRDLCKLCGEQDETTNTGKASPFILLMLKYPLEGMEGALLRSLLEIDCLNSLTNEQSIGSLGADRLGCWEEIDSPVLSLDESIELIRSTGLDSHLLFLRGPESNDPTGVDSEQDGSLSYPDEKNSLSRNCLEVELHKETVSELEAAPELEAATEQDKAPEQDSGTQVQAEEDQKDRELLHPCEAKKEEPTRAYTLCHRRTKGSYAVSLCKPDSSWTKYKHQGLACRLIQFPPPPLKGGITVTMEDLQCLDSGQFLNDVIIDFYLKYLLHNTSAALAERSHIFSSFFYKQLTRRDNASEGVTSDSCQRQRRHQRVKTWTRHVDIFKKDFLFVPVNQEAHWYLVVICFPGLLQPKFESWPVPDSQTATSHEGSDESQDKDEAQTPKSPDHNTETPPALNPSDTVATETEKAEDEPTKVAPPGPVNCTEKTFQKKVVCKRPCILIMDSLKLSLHERVFKLLREYLQSEWEVRRGSSQEFGPDQMKSSHCQVPLQDNSSDCGLYLLQYVESFLKDPVVHFDLPLHLQRWFPRQQVRRKRDEIRDLVLNLYRRQNLDNNR